MLQGFVEISNRTKQIISAQCSEDDMYVHCQCDGSDVREATQEEVEGYCPFGDIEKAWQFSLLVENGEIE